MRAVLEARSGLAPEQIDTLCAFGQALIEKNKVMNLTAITEPQAVAELHFLDCIALLQAEDFSGKRVIDVGCGAGFPGVPLKIAEPSIRLTLLDSLAKRMTWLREILPQLGVEEGGHLRVQLAEQVAGPLDDGDLQPQLPQVLRQLHPDEPAPGENGRAGPLACDELPDAEGVLHGAQGEQPGIVQAGHGRLGGLGPWGEQELVVALLKFRPCV